MASNSLSARMENPCTATMNHARQARRECSFYARFISIMRIFDRYLIKQILSSTLLGVIVLCLIMVLGNLFKEIRPLLVEQRAPLVLVGKFLLNVLPYSLSFTLPLGFLAAVLLTFTRLSMDQEINSLRIAGVSLFRVAIPVYIVGFFLSLLCLWINLDVAPHSRGNMKSLLYEEFLKNPQILLDPGAAQSRFRDQLIFIDGRQGDILRGFHLYQTPEKSSKTLNPPPAYLHANRVELFVDQEKKQFRLTLLDSMIESTKPDGTTDIAFSKETRYWYLGFSDSTNRRIRAPELSNEEIRTYLATTPDLSPRDLRKFQSEYQQRYAMAFASLSFAFVAIPLGIRSKRRDSSSGLVITLLIGVGYFLFGMLADSGKSPATMILLHWLPNILCLALGLYLMRRARFR